jgi:hypothetical protein
MFSKTEYLKDNKILIDNEFKCLVDNIMPTLEADGIYSGTFTFECTAGVLIAALEHAVETFRNHQWDFQYAMSTNELHQPIKDVRVEVK